jgi:hypothetical protein
MTLLECDWQTHRITVGQMICQTERNVLHLVHYEMRKSLLKCLPERCFCVSGGNPRCATPESESYACHRDAHGRVTESSLECIILRKLSNYRERKEWVPLTPQRLDSQCSLKSRHAVCTYSREVVFPAHFARSENHICQSIQIFTTWSESWVCWHKRSKPN